MRTCLLRDPRAGEAVRADPQRGAVHLRGHQHWGPDDERQAGERGEQSFMVTLLPLFLQRLFVDGEVTICAYPGDDAGV